METRNNHLAIVGLALIGFGTLACGESGGDGQGSGAGGTTISSQAGGSGGSSGGSGGSGAGGLAGSGGSANGGAGSAGSGGKDHGGAAGAAKGGAAGAANGGAAGAANGGAAGGTTAKGGAAGGPATGGAAGGTVAKGGAAGGTAKGGAAGGTAGAGGTVVPTTLPPAGDFTEKVGSASIDMIAIPGGTFTLGCETGTCDPDTTPVENITVSDYHIMKTEVPKAMWTATGRTEGTWYDCMAVACELSKKTGKAYRMMTEAEFEYAAKKHLDKLSQVEATEEWAFNSWETKYSCKPGDVDPVGPSPASHTQKTRRDKATGDKITGRLIRSIDGIGPKCRLTISDKMESPPGYPPACSITPIVQVEEPDNSYRDPRWVTGSDAKWTTGSLGIGKFDFQTWDDGTAVMNGKPGQWFTSNNIALVFVPSSGTSVKYAYIFLDGTQGSVISDAGFMNGFVGRYQKTTATGTTKPTISGLKSGEELATAAGADFKMVDMQNIPESVKKQDPRLIDTTSDCWFQNNINAGGTHNYRKDVDADEFRFAVIDKGQVVMLANGKWWTLNNTLLHIEHSDGYVAEYLYAVTSDGYFMHNSFMKYERADFRMFQKYENAGGKFPATCINDSCSKELAKGAASSLYSKQGETGKSTFTPAKCPAAGCK